MKTPAEQYVERYYQGYISGPVDQERDAVGRFLIENAKGKILDCGCGPVPQIWAIFMPRMEEYYAIDVPKESIDFVKDKLAHIPDWYIGFDKYKKEVEKNIGPMPAEYVLQQFGKIRSVERADMSTELPFSPGYFDTSISLYSLGCLKSEAELEQATRNIKQVLKPGGSVLHVNTNGYNKNNDLPAYTWNGLSQSADLIRKYLEQEGFVGIVSQEVSLDSDQHGRYTYDTISLLRATKPSDLQV